MGAISAIEMKLLVLLTLALFTGGVNGHGAMLNPPPRNAIDSTIPGDDWGDGQNHTGILEGLGVSCTNGTESCRPGQSVFWFSQGCTPGCETCDSQGQRIQNWDHCAATRKAPFNATLAKKYWTSNRNATENSEFDLWKFQPFRSPGLAPLSDVCGMAGGSPKPVFNGGEYTKTIYGKQGDLGSKVLKPRPTGITWKSGSVVNVSWYIAYNHAGGYKYRVCPASEPLSEECFARPEHQLEFVSNTSVVKFKSGDRRIPNTVIREGGGIGWMLNPIPMPNFVGSDCDNMDGKPCHGCPCGSHYPGGNDENGVCVDGLCYGKNPFGKSNMGKNTAIEDEVLVPANLPAGDYVVGFRWDCETSSQIWTSCADLTIE